MEVQIDKVVEVDNALTHEEFNDLISAIVSENSERPLFLLFSGEKVDGRSWCPDCVRAEPILLAALEEYSPTSALVVFLVKREEYRNQPGYTYRTNPAVLLKCVPTLHR
jgi:thiol-disulfide isomerase/thioredoxin